jgi:hypothetical protein
MITKEHYINKLSGGRLLMEGRKWLILLLDGGDEGEGMMAWTCS